MYSFNQINAFLKKVYKQTTSELSFYQRGPFSFVRGSRSVGTTLDVCKALVLNHICIFIYLLISAEGPNLT